MRVLVTGCHGFLGHHVTAALLARGHQVVGLDRISGARSPKADRIAKFGKDATFHEVDLKHFGRTHAAIAKARPDVIFHAAGQYSIRYSTENLQHYIDGNLILPLYVYEAARLSGVHRVVLASSQAISDARRPSGIYGASKAFGEEALAAYCHRYDMAGVALRYGVLYGPMIRRDTEFFRTVNDHLAGRMAKPGSQFDKRTPLIEVRDAAEIAVRTIEAETTGMLTLPAIAYDTPRSYRDVLLCAAYATDGKVRWPSEPPERGPAEWSDLSATHHALGWYPKIRLEQGMEDYLKWARTAIT